jgi:predicted nuclease of restriction endonuclease-like (RecB) superfamily
MQLTNLSQHIDQLDHSFGQAAAKAVNSLLTARNWLIGFYIVEYEHNGQDRAEYGKSLTKELAKRLNTKGLSARNLWLYRQFFLTYPQIGTAILESPLIQNRIVQSPSALLENDESQNDAGIVPSPLSLSVKNSKINDLEIVHTPYALLENSLVWKDLLDNMSKVHSNGERLIQKLAFSHLKLLIPMDDHLKRAFYEVECIKGTWSVRELKRQISTLSFERSALSKDPEALSKLTQEKIPFTPDPRHIAKDIYTFEFLGLPEHLAVEESDLETALLEHLQEFLFELGHGFCLEARQKRILIGDEYYFIDLVFYHRILKRHILIELKIGDFSHENAGQLNTYLNYYKAEIVEKGDNPPIGLLLVADKNTPLVEYAIAGMDEQLFVKKYLVNLPQPKELENFIINQLQQSS